MILHIRNIISKHEKTYALRSYADFKKIFADYPQLVNLTLKSKNLKTGAHDIAEYFNMSSHISSWLSSGVAKSEKELEVEAEPEVDVKFSPQEDFKTSLEIWVQTRMENDRETSRDTTFTPDIGRVRDKKLDKPRDITSMDRIKSNIEAGKDENR